MTSKPFVASHTNLACFETCPRQFHHRYILKDLPFEDSEALRWGNRVHEALEARCKRGRLAALPEGMQQYEMFAQAIDRYGDDETVEVEVKHGMSVGGKWTGFFAGDVWFRGKIDIAIIRGASPTAALILDWKTGRRREDPTELEEHAMLLKAAMPGLEKISGAYVWLKDMVIGEVHALNPEAALKRTRQTVERIETQLRKENFPPNPSGLCKAWCSVMSCEHNGRRA